MKNKDNLSEFLSIRFVNYPRKINNQIKTIYKPCNVLDTFCKIWDGISNGLILLFRNMYILTLYIYCTLLIMKRPRVY